MRKYYLFGISKNSYYSYHNNSEILYKTLENLYNLKHRDFSYGISIYNQLCDIFNYDVLTNYFDKIPIHVKKRGKKYIVQDIYEHECYIIEIRHACIIILCENNLPKILRLLNYYNPRIFICDFENGDYFWNNQSFSNNKFFEQYNLI